MIPNVFEEGMKAKPRGPRYRSLRASAALTLALGCASGPYVGRVQPYGRGFVVTYDSIWGAARAREAAVYDANRYCDERELKMMPDSETAKPGLRASVALVFHCETASREGQAPRPPLSQPPRAQ